MERKQNQTFFHGTYSNLTLYLFLSKYIEVFQWLIIGTFQSHCKCEHNQIKSNKIAQDMCKSDSIFFICKIVNYLNDFWKLFLAKAFYERNWTHLAQKNSQPGSKINTIFRLSWKCINCFIIKIFYKHLVCFKHHNHAMDLKLGFKAGEEDQYATNFRLGLKTKKKNYRH